jgi:hypothetical protein
MPDVFFAERNPRGNEMTIPRIVPQRPMAIVSMPRNNIFFHLEKSGGNISFIRDTE